MKKKYELTLHPNIVGRKPMLDPNQSGLLVNRGKSLQKKEAGDLFEKKVADSIRKFFPDAKLINNAYFETGKYRSKLFLYESVQIDHILITEDAVFCIEDKYIDNDKHINISGNAKAKQWRVKNTRGTVTTETNGLKQNYGHLCFLEELFEFENLDIPVIQITVIGGISREKIRIQQFIDANLVDEEELPYRIRYIIERQSYKGLNKINVEDVHKIVEKWICKVPDIEKLHLVYLRNKEKNCLPKRCKKALK